MTEINLWIQPVAAKGPAEGEHAAVPSTGSGDDTETAEAGFASIMGDMLSPVTHGAAEGVPRSGAGTQAPADGASVAVSGDAPVGIDGEHLREHASSKQAIVPATTPVEGEHAAETTRPLFEGAAPRAAQPAGEATPELARSSPAVAARPAAPQPQQASAADSRRGTTPVPDMETPQEESGREARSPSPDASAARERAVPDAAARALREATPRSDGARASQVAAPTAEAGAASGEPAAATPRVVLNAPAAPEANLLFRPAPEATHATRAAEAVSSGNVSTPADEAFDASTRVSAAEASADDAPADADLFERRDAEARPRLESNASHARTMEGSVSAETRADVARPQAAAPELRTLTPVATERGDARPSTGAVVRPQLVDEALRLVRLGQRRAEIVLDPPELGRLRLHLNVHGQSIMGSIEAESAAVVEALKAELSQLMASFQEQGLDAAGLRVTLLDEQSAHARRERRGHEPRQSARGAEDTDTPSRSAATTHVETGSLDYLL